MSRIRAAAEAWKAVESESQPADRWIGNFFYRNRKKFGSRDRRFISQALYNLFRHKTFLKIWTRHLTGREDDSSLLIILSACLDGLLSPEESRELLQLSGIEREAAASLEKILQFDFPPGVEFKSREGFLASRYSFPLWLVERWSRRWGEEKTEDLLKVFEKRPPLIVRANPLKIERKVLLETLRAKGAPARASKVSPWGIVFEDRHPVFDWEEFQSGLFEVQDTGSQLVCSLISPKAGENVWDVCAGGGGKSLLLAAMMQNKGRIVATDIRPLKLADLKKRAKRAGVFNIFPADLNRMNELKTARAGFDKILVDAPCSGTGTLRRNPDAKWKLSETRFLEHQKDQFQILKSVVPYLRKGGMLYYVTCSLEPAEDEEVMEKLFEEFRGILRPLRLESRFGEWSGCGMRLWPSEENDGFFAGVAEKI